MKKGRPGYLVTVIALPETSAALARLMARELGTLGIRCIPAIDRLSQSAQRQKSTWRYRDTGNTCPVKCGWMDGHIYTYKAEFDAARNWAAELDLPVRDMLLAAQKAAEKQADKLQPRERPGDR